MTSPDPCRHCDDTGRIQPWLACCQHCDEGAAAVRADIRAFASYVAAVAAATLVGIFMGRIR